MTGKQKLRNEVIHVARNPKTGVWSSLVQLINAQVSAGRYSPSAIFYCDPDWISRYGQAARDLPCKIVLRPLPERKGSYLCVAADRDVARVYGKGAASDARSMPVLHFHDAWMSSLYFYQSFSVAHWSWTITTHGVRSLPIYKKSLYKALLYKVPVSTGVLTSVDRSGIEGISDIFGVPESDVWLVPNGLAYSGAVTNARCIEGRITIGFVGNLIPSKGWKIAVEAADLLHSVGVPVSMIVAGDGPDREQLLALARERPYVDYRGYVEDAAEQVISELDVLLLPSKFEGQPMVILEALARGVPVVATRTGGIPDMIDHEQSGMLTAPVASEVCSAILAMLEPIRYRSMSLHARRVFAERFSISRVEKMYGNVYDAAKRKCSLSTFGQMGA